MHFTGQYPISSTPCAREFSYAFPVKVRRAEMSWPEADNKEFRRTREKTLWYPWYVPSCTESKQHLDLCNEQI